MKYSLVPLFAVLLAGCGPDVKITSAFDDPQTVATVGAEKITQADIKAAQARASAPAEAVLEELIEHRMLVQEARAKGYDRDPQMIEAFEKTLANRVREERRQTAAPEIAPAEIEARYRAHAEKFAVPAKVRAAMIFVEAPQNFSGEKRAERRATIDAARAAAQENPAKFPELVAQYSFDQTTKFRGGDLGWLMAGVGAEELAPEVTAAAFALKNAGDLSDVIATAQGFYVLKLIDRAEPLVRPLAEVRGQILAELQRERHTRFEEENRKALAAQHRVEVRRERLPATSQSGAKPTDPPAAPVLGIR